MFCWSKGMAVAFNIEKCFQENKELIQYGGQPTDIGGQYHINVDIRNI